MRNTRHLSIGNIFVLEANLANFIVEEDEEEEKYQEEKKEAKVEVQNERVAFADLI